MYYYMPYMSPFCLSVLQLLPVMRAASACLRFLVTIIPQPTFGLCRLFAQDRRSGLSFGRSASQRILHIHEQVHVCHSRGTLEGLKVLSEGVSK